MSVLKIKNESIAINSIAGNNASRSFPNICITKTSRLICVCRSAPKKESVVGQSVKLAFSDDFGKTWSHPKAPFIAPEICGVLGSFRAGTVTAFDDGNLLACLYWTDTSNPDKPFYNPQTEGIVDSRLFYSKSSDDGETWSTPVQFLTSPFDMPIAITGPILDLNNGNFAVQFETYKDYDAPEQLDHKPVLMFGSIETMQLDGYAIPAHSPKQKLFFWDQRPVRIAENHLLDFFWMWG